MTTILWNCSRAEQFLFGKSRMRDHSIGETCKPQRLSSPVQCVPMIRQPARRRGHAMIVEDDAPFAVGQQRQQIQQRVILWIINDDEIGGKQFTPAVALRPLGMSNRNGSQRRMNAAIIADDDANMGTAIKKVRSLLGDVPTNGIAGASILRQ